MLNVVLASLAAVIFFTAVRYLDPLNTEVRFPLLGVAALFLFGEIMVVHLQFRRDAYTFSLAEMALVLSLYFAEPTHVVIGQVIGSGIALLVIRRQSLLKSAFNVAHYALEAGLAATIFHTLVPDTTTAGPATWGAVLFCTMMVVTLGTISVGTAISLSGANLRIRSMLEGLGYGYAIMLTNTCLALLGVRIITLDPGSAWLLAVPTLLLFISYRAYIAQREKRESVELLYESSRSVQRQRSAEQAIVKLLTQAREMFRAETAQMIIFSEDEDGIGFRSQMGPDDTAFVMKQEPLDPKQGVWARVASEGHALLINAPIDNDRLRVYFAGRNVYKDAMVAPLFGQDGVIGTMLVGDRLGEVSSFDSEDLKLFETLANHASVSLENARLVDQLRESLAHLTEMNRLKDDFVAAVSHELRTPLTSIQGYIKTLMRPEMRNFPLEEQKSFLEAADRQSERLRSLIEDLLVVARLDAQQVTPTITPMRVVSLTERVFLELRDRQLTHTLTTDLPQDLPVISSDEGKIQQILTNLVDNACKYSPEGTTVTVSAHPEGDGLTISVADQGHGIPPSEHERIFDRFYQVDQSSTRAAGGTGLGLYLCRRLAEAVGGRIWLESSSDAGSVFSVWVPVHPTEVLPSEIPLPSGI